MRTESSRTGPPAKRLAVQSGAPGSSPIQGRIPTPAEAAEALAGRQFLLLGGSCAQAEGPGVNALAEHLESVGGRVAVLPAVGIRTGLFGGRALDRPDLVVAILPARGSSMSAVRLAERLGSPLLALLTSEAPGSRTETAALRRATRVAVTTTDLQHAAIAAGVAQDRVDRWDVLRPSALSHFDQIAARTLRTTAKPRVTRS